MSCEALGVTLIDVVGEHVLKFASAKSLSVAVNDCELRVCGRKDDRQPVKPRSFRLIPPSISSFVWTCGFSEPSALRQTQPPQSTAPCEFTPKVTELLLTC